MTYISPYLYLSNSMNAVEKKSNNIIATLVGGLIVICLILIEKKAIEHFQNSLSKIIEFLVLFKWLF